MEPIVIVGCQRSGSTMLGAMLGTHSKIVAIPEAQFFVDCMPDNADVIADSNDIESSIKGHYRFKIWNYELPISYLGNAKYAKFFKWFIAGYAQDIHKKKPDAWVDHQPGHVKHIAKIKEFFPNVKVIHVLRDGRAVANSIIPLDWGPNSINRAAYFWEQRVGYGLAVQRYLGEESCMTIRYEDIILDPQSSVKTLCNFLGFEYEDSMLSASGLKVPEFTVKQHSLVGGILSRERISGWQKELPKREVEIFEGLTGDLLTYLGYEKLYPKGVAKLSIPERVLNDAKHIYKSLMNSYHFKQRVKKHTKES
jgi:hypothetical protein